MSFKDATAFHIAALPPLAWRPAPFVSTSIVLHALILIGLFAEPQQWRVWLLVFAGNHLFICAAVMLPRNHWIGANITRLPEAAARRGEIALTLDDGPDPAVTPQVLDLLDRHAAKASFFCIGERAQAYPDLVREILRRGHSVENHSLRHDKTFAFRGWQWTRTELENSQQVLAQITGQMPRFFRAPAGFRNPLLDPILALAGLRYAAWTRRGFDSVRGDSASVLRRLRRNWGPGFILLMHDGHPAKTAAGVPVILEALPILLDEIQQRGWRVVSLPMAFEVSGAD
jgi:peptidoglycan/xylan/chitin deacetylase (PgdA/CDA1 family)